ncbi:L-serine ammonia-lyase [Corynebacterium sp.]|uniref:L-serine ammonia-lyase n=1 Tax=Corynebacterium sp. TaxID=1720 RepID=UPI0026DF4060|nr:L-serine ammonia-lyase [Corynebacterium sp.]MDO5511825.1 L-serine ammonia-lyase [Corynebacterium sp.]
MSPSVRDLFSIGIGPSSSHTVGPMRAAAAFVDKHGRPEHIDITLRGSLAATGIGHGTDRAILLGLLGHTPDNAPEDPPLGSLIDPTGTFDGLSYAFTFDPEPAPEHPNCVEFSADGAKESYFSVGGGFIATREDLDAEPEEQLVPYPFDSGAKLLAHCAREELNFSQVMAANEGDVDKHLDEVWQVMQDCVQRGLTTTGLLPGSLGVVRRAPGLQEQLAAGGSGAGLEAMEWVNLWALAVNEENAAGGRVVTAPTNGAAGIIPATMHYAREFLTGFDDAAARRFLHTAGAVGMIIKHNASISGAEVGCQGEVGSAAAMAAAGLCEFLGGTPAQVENAAEIALEHNLGLTCDPVGGLVQIPCIERNAIGAVKAINAARLAWRGSGTNRVSLDEVIATMADTGRDMMSKYKETSTGGLAVNLGLPVALTEC